MAWLSRHFKKLLITTGIIAVAFGSTLVVEEPGYIYVCEKEDICNVETALRVEEDTYDVTGLTEVEIIGTQAFDIFIDPRTEKAEMSPISVSEYRKYALPKGNINRREPPQRFTPEPRQKVWIGVEKPLFNTASGWLEQGQYAVEHESTRRIGFEEVNAAVGYDTGTDSGALTDVTSASFSHTTDPSANLVYAIAHAQDNTSTDLAISSGTWNGAAMTFTAEDYESGQSDNATGGMYIAGGATGTNTIVLNWGGTVSAGRVYAHSLTGVDTSDPVDTFDAVAQANTDVFTISVTTTNDNSFLAGGILAANAARTFPSNGTDRFAESTGSPSRVWMSSTKTTTSAGSNSIVWTCSGSNCAKSDYSGIVMAFNEDAGGGVTPVVNQQDVFWFE